MCLCLCDIRSRLKAKNLMYIKQILFVIEGLIRVLGGQCVHAVRIWTVNVSLTDIDIAGKVGQNPQSQATQTGQ